MAQLVVDLSQGRLGGLEAPLDAVVPVHQHLGLDDGYQPRLLAQRRVPRQGVGVDLQAVAARGPVADGEYAAPFGEPRAQLVVLGQPVPKAVEALGHLLSGGAGQGSAARVRLDAEDDPLVLEHPVGENKYLAPIFNRGPYPLSGDTNTILQSAVDPLKIDAPARFMPSLRMVVDVGEWDEARFVLPGGQSGNPLSPHYDDQLRYWLRGESLKMPFSDEAVDSAALSTLRLAPEKGEA